MGQLISNVLGPTVLPVLRDQVKNAEMQKNYMTTADIKPDSPYYSGKLTHEQPLNNQAPVATIMPVIEPSTTMPVATTQPYNQPVDKSIVNIPQQPSTSSLDLMQNANGFFSQILMRMFMQFLGQLGRGQGYGGQVNQGVTLNNTSGVTYNNNNKIY